MTLRDLPKRGVSEATYTQPPVVLASTGSWTTGGLSDYIDDEHFQALKKMSGLTYDPSVIERLDGNTE